MCVSEIGFWVGKRKVSFDTISGNLSKRFRVFFIGLVAFW